MRRGGRLGLHQHPVGAGAGDALQVPLGLGDHQVRLDRLAGRGPRRADGGRAEADRGDEAAVHDVHVDQVGPGPVGRLHLRGQPAEVGGEDRGRDLCHVGAPSRKKRPTARAKPSSS
jgi:hypothetical protein